MNTKETKKFDVYQMVTDRVIAQMEKGFIPWKQPWFNVNDGAFSHSTGECYSVLNQCILGNNHEYITWSEIKKENGKLKKGAKQKQVVFWKMMQKAVTDENGQVVKDKDGKDKMKTWPMLRYYAVYDIADTEGIKPRERKVGKAEDNVKAEDIVKDYITRSGVTLHRSTTSNEAFYRPSTDTITIPMKKQFKTTAGYYSTLFHEMTHSTGHESRLNRLAEDASFGSEKYSKEELVAELGAASLTNYCGLEIAKSFNNSVAYLENWLTALKNDKKLIVSASGRAQKAVNLILGVEEKKKQEKPETASPVFHDTKIQSKAELMRDIEDGKNVILITTKNMHWPEMIGQPRPVSSHKKTCFTLKTHRDGKDVDSWLWLKDFTLKDGVIKFKTCDIEMKAVVRAA